MTDFSIFSMTLLASVVLIAITMYSYEQLQILEDSTI